MLAHRASLFLTTCSPEPFPFTAVMLCFFAAADSKRAATPGKDDANKQGELGLVKCILVNAKEDDKTAKTKSGF